MPESTNSGELKASCSSCSLQQFCLTSELEKEDIERLESIVQRNRPLPKGSHIYMPGHRFVALYAIRAGSVKTYVLGTDGQEYVTGFYLPGEVIGLDAVYSGDYPCGARTLETTSLCEIPYDRLEDLAAISPNIARQLLRMMSHELRSDEQLLMMVGKHSAESRLASLLLSLSSRLQRRGYSPKEFYLSMSRADIGSFLGLAVETVSRLIKRLEEQEVIEVHHRQVRLLDMDRLKGISSEC